MDILRPYPVGYIIDHITTGSLMLGLFPVGLHSDQLFTAGAFDHRQTIVLSPAHQFRY
jgi:hypothetical protein